MRPSLAVAGVVSSMTSSADDRPITRRFNAFPNLNSPQYAAALFRYRHQGGSGMHC